MVKVVVTNYDFKLKVKNVVGDYSFDHKKKEFKTIVTNYGFITVIILESSLVYSLKKKKSYFFVKTVNL